MKTLKTTLIGLLGAGLMLYSLSSSAVDITITGAADPALDGQWDITEVTDTFNNLQTELEMQPWWGDGAGAAQFATALGAADGFPNTGFVPIPVVGPLFDFACFTGGTACGVFSELAEGWGLFEGVGGLVEAFPDSDVVFTYAEATAIASVPEPTTLTLLGLGLAGLGLARRRRPR